MNSLIDSIFILILTGVVHVYTQGVFKFSPQTYAKAIFTECQGNPEFIANISCKLKAVNWEHNVAYFDGDLLRVVRNITVHAELHKYTNQFRPYLINMTVNYCDLFEKGNFKNPIIRSAKEFIAKYSNLYHKCPYSGHLYVHDAYFDIELIRFYVPLGTYKLVFTFYEGWPYIYLGGLTYKFKISERNNETNTVSQRRHKSKA